MVVSYIKILKSSAKFTNVFKGTYESPRVAASISWPLLMFRLGDSRNYMPPILVPSSAKRIATQILVIAKLNGRKDFILRIFVCDIIRPSKKLPVQS